MKILHLLYESKGDCFGVGGVATRAYEIYRLLKGHHEIALLCKRYPGFDGEDKGEGICKEIDGLRHIFVGTESESLSKTLLSYAFHASRFVEKYGNDYDIIIEDFSPAIPTFLHVYTRRPIILQVQGYTGSHYFRKYNPFYATALFIFEKIRPQFYKNFIFINNETVKRVLGDSILGVSEGGFFASKDNKFVGVIPNGISPELLDVVPEDGDYILYLGRIDIYGKGLDILLKAYKEFFKSFPDIRLVIAGDGRDRKRFEAMIMLLPHNIRKNIELTGWVDGKQKIEILRKALFCVLPSRHEVQAITAIEAMACGKVVIVSDIPEFGYITNNGAGLSFRTGDANSLASVMKVLLNREERSEMKQRSKELASCFKLDRIAVDFEKFLLMVIERRL